MIHAACIIGILRAGFATRTAHTGGWRKVDREALDAKLRAEDLVKHEASWYRAVPEDGDRRP